MIASSEWIDQASEDGDSDDSLRWTPHPSQLSDEIVRRIYEVAMALPDKQKSPRALRVIIAAETQTAFDGADYEQWFIAFKKRLKELNLPF